MSVEALKLDFKDGSSAEVDFNETDPGDGKAPLVHLWPAPGISEEELREKVQSILDKYFTYNEPASPAPTGAKGI